MTTTTELPAATTASAIAQFEAQGSIAPGTPGWWKVWGASVHAIRPGDLVMIASDTPGEPNIELVSDTFLAKAYPMRAGLIDPNGAKFTVGALVPVVVLRWGTGHTLA